MEATITFLTRLQAETFATKWTKHTKEGTIVGSGFKNVDVTVFNVNIEGKTFIDNYIKSLNKKVE
jgi:hypothetical protein